MHSVVEEYISSCYMKKCLGGGGRLCCVALNEDKMAMLNLFLDSFIKPNW